MRAAPEKAASAGVLPRRRYAAPYGRQRSIRHARMGNCRQQGAGIRVRRGPEDFLHRCSFHDPAGVHHGDPVCCFRHDPEVMGHQDHAHIVFFPHFVDQVQDLSLDRYVQSGGGFVGDQQRRFPRQSHGDHDPLLHAAGKFMGIGIDPAFRGGDPHQLKQPDHFLPDLADFRPVEFDDFRDLFPDTEYRIEGGGWFLKNVGDPAATDFAEFSCRSVRQFLPLKRDFPGADLYGRFG